MLAWNVRILALRRIEEMVSGVISTVEDLHSSAAEKATELI
jgi:hypothetical protein